ncbi:hypothetical protein SRABI134_05001 [Peribacillus sp. Bi134]|nr:hypothetical protein SRABI134_05001 [Peribacillus sp. Bi134]
MHIFIKKFFFAGLGNKELTYVPYLRYDYPDLQLIFLKMVVLKRRVGKEKRIHKSA